MVLGIDIDIPWPDIPLPTWDEAKAKIKEYAIQILNYLGYPWPMADEGVLRGWAGQWRGLEGTLNGYVAELEGGVNHVKNSNEGPAVNAFSSFMTSDESGVESVRGLANAAPRIASGYEAAALAVEAMRLAAIAKLMIDVISIACAIITGGASAGASLLARKGVSAGIDFVIDQAINKILGG